MAIADERVRVWNSFLALAREQADKLNSSIKGRPLAVTPICPKGEVLPPVEFFSLATLALLGLAVEARITHLLDELAENKISPELAEAVKWAKLEEKWPLLPELSGHRQQTTLSGAHAAVSKIVKLRNVIFHARFDDLKRKLPSPDEILMLFRDFMKAEEDLSVIMGRKTDIEQAALDLGKFI